MKEVHRWVTKQGIVPLEVVLASDHDALVNRLEAALRWTVMELENSPAFTEDDLCKPPPDVEATIRAVFAK